MISLDGHGGAVRSVAFSPDSTALAASGDDGNIRVWDTHAGEAFTELTGHAGTVRALAFSRDGASLAAGGDGGTVRVWDVRTRELRAEPTGHASTVRAVAFSPDGDKLAAGGDQGVRVWDARTGEPDARLTGRTGCVCAVAFSPDDATLAAGGDDGSVRVWDARTGGLRAKLTGHSGTVRAVAFSPDSAMLAAGGDGGTVRVWDVHTRELRAELTGHAGTVLAVAFSPDGTMLAAGGDKGAIRVWDADSGELGTRLTDHTGYVGSVACGPNEVYAAVCGNRKIRLWTVRRHWWSVWRQTMSWRLALEPIPDIFDWYKRNAAAGTALLGVFLVVKGYVIAKGDLSTALGILQSAGLASAVIAGLLSALPILTASMLAFNVYRAVRPIRVTRVPSGGLHVPAASLVVVMVAAAVLSAVFTPWTFMAGAVVIGLAIALGRRLLKGPMADWRRTRLAVAPLAGLLLLAATVGAVVAMLYTVWVPHEIVDFTPGPKGQPPAQEVGYVLTEGDGWITILTSGPHQIVRFSDSAVKSFMVCQRGPHGGWSDLADASTLWQEITRLPFLTAVHAVANAPCPPPTASP
jgi:hypothetical protein